MAVLQGSKYKYLATGHRRTSVFPAPRINGTENSYKYTRVTKARPFSVKTADERQTFEFK